MVGGVRFGSGGARAGVDGGGAPPSLLCRVPSAELPMLPKQLAGRACSREGAFRLLSLGSSPEKKHFGMMIRPY